MRLLIKYSVLLHLLTLSILTPVFAQQDSLVSIDGVEFSDGTVPDSNSSIQEEDSLLAVPTDLIFTDGEADSVAQDSVSLSDAGLPADSKPEKQSLWGIFIAGLIG
ncbi:hypothetical protein ACFSSD_14870, partial [Sphingobacterium griseoflavum]